MTYASSQPDLMRQSPYDTDNAPGPLVQLQRPPKHGRWRPSQFNARVMSDDGRIVLWNTLTGALCVIPARHRDLLSQLLSQQGLSGELRGLAQYLYEHGYLVEQDSDELQQLRLLVGRQHFRNDHLELILLATEDCNFRCKYCYEDFKRGTMRSDVREGVKALLRRRAPKLRSLSVHWFGGEPLYGFDAVSDIAPFVADLVEEYGLAFDSHITTNGYLLTPNVADSLLRWGVRRFQITLDGPARTHDRSRVGRDGRPTFNVIYSNLRALQNRRDGFLVLLRVNYDRDNCDALEEFVEMAGRDFGGDDRFNLLMVPVGRWGGENDANLDICGLDERNAVRIRMRALAKDYGFDMSTFKQANNFGSNVCYAARPYSFVVGADGKLMKCTVALDKQDHNIVGQLSADGQMTLNDRKLSMWTAPAFESDKVCQSCHLVPICQGMLCPLVRIETGTRECSPTKSRLRDVMLERLTTGPHTARPEASV